MTRTSIKAALVGCGRIAGHHCHSIADTPGVELAAVCDLEEAKARAYGEEFSVPWHTNYRDMLGRDPGIDTVAVITPSGMHAEHGMEMLERYGKNLILEKPTVMRPADLMTIYEAADRLGLHVFPGLPEPLQQGGAEG